MGNASVTGRASLPAKSRRDKDVRCRETRTQLAEMETAVFRLAESEGVSLADVKQKRA